MNCWTELIQADHAWAHSKDGFRLVLRDGASDAEIDEIARQLEFHPPQEFRDLYRCHDGVGITRQAGLVADYWTFVPLADLPTLAKDARAPFEKTHPDLAKRFVPFIDWACGDYSGYVLDSDMNPIEGIFMFEHEAYAYDSEQDPNEFLTSTYSSIAEFLEVD